MRLWMVAKSKDKLKDCFENVNIVAWSCHAEPIFWEDTFGPENMNIMSMHWLPGLQAGILFKPARL